MQIFKFSSTFFIFIFLIACAPVEPFVIKERTAPPAIDEIDETIFFEFDSDVISEMEMIKLENLVAEIKKQKSLLIEIHGHTDEVGDNTYNIELAQRRATAVKEAIESFTTSLPPIKLFSWGEEIPKEDEESKKARTKNRRVEIVILP